MFRVTRLVAHERIDQNPHTDRLEIPRPVAASERNHLITSTQSINMQQTCVYECIRWKRKWFWEFWCRNHQNRSCGCKDMKKRSYMDLFGISRKWLGLNRNLFLKTRGLLKILWIVAWLQRNPGASFQNSWDNWFSDLFLNTEICELSPHVGRPRLLRPMVNQGARGSGSSSECGLVAALGL
jgi:hypothetical protein